MRDGGNTSVNLAIYCVYIYSFTDGVNWKPFKGYHYIFPQENCNEDGSSLRSSQSVK